MVTLPVMMGLFDYKVRTQDGKFIIIIINEI